MSLAFGPRARPAAGLQVGEHRLFPLVEALPVHVPAHGAGVVVAGDADGVAEVVQGDEHGVVVVGMVVVLLGTETVTGGHAATGETGDFLGGIDAAAAAQKEALNLAVLAARGHPCGTPR